MKKITSTLLSFVMIFCMMLTGCQLKRNNKSSEVSLISISASAYEEKNVKAAKFMVYSEETNLGENEIDLETKDSETTVKGSGEENSSEESSGREVKEEEKDEPIFSEKTTYTFIFKSQLDINFDIKLNNPKNYYIMDFKLTCDEEDIQYYDEKMEKWTSINDIWIRWSGSNNQESRYRLRLPNPEISPNKIKISEMYYSDRTDGTNKTAVNMNNKETYTIYKIEDDLLNCETVSNVKDKYTFKINKKDGVEITKFTVGGVDYMNTEADADGNYEMTADGKIEIEYQLNVKDNIVYIGKWERDIVVFNYDAEIDREFESIKFKNIYGTDLPKYCLIEEVFTDNYIYIGILDHNMCYSLIKLKSIRLILVNELLMDDNGEFIIPDSAGISSVMF